MSEGNSVSAKQEGDDHQDRDLLSNLPLCIIHIILERIPIRDAVRTSILSKEWRYKWRSLPQIVFDDEFASKEDELQSKYEDIITWVVLNHEGPIQRFRLSCSVRFRKAVQLVTCLSLKGIKELILEQTGSAFWMEMQSRLYYCEKLTYLQLHCCAFDPPPMTFKGFLFLRYLSIFGTFYLNSDYISRTVAGCPVLETFELVQRSEKELNISAPNLKYMRLQGAHKVICIDAPQLTELSVVLTKRVTKAPDQELKTSACDYASSLAGFTNLQTLVVTCYFTKFLSSGIELCHHLLVFHHLKFIAVELDFQNVKEIRVLARLLYGAPSLRHLIVIGYYEIDESDSEVPHLSLEDLGFASNLKLENLTDVSLLNFNISLLKAEFLKILFESSPVLETVRIDTEENQNKVRAILQGCNWVSPPIVKPCQPWGYSRTISGRFWKPF